MNARTRYRSHTTFPPRHKSEDPSLSICNADHTLQHKFGGRLSQNIHSAAQHLRGCFVFLRRKNDTPSVLRFPLSNKSHLFRMIPQRRSTDQRTRSGLLLTSLRRDALHVGSIHDSDDAIKAVHGLHVVNHEEGLSTWRGISQFRGFDEKWHRTT